MAWSFRVVEVQRNNTRVGLTGCIFWDDGIVGPKPVRGGLFVLGAWDNGTKPTLAEVKATAQTYLNNLIGAMKADQQATNSLKDVDVAIVGETLTFPVPLEG